MYLKLFHVWIQCGGAGGPSFGAGTSTSFSIGGER
jgi:hypothetical protein